MRFPWQRKRELDEAARIERGKLANAVLENDRARLRIAQRVQEGRMSDFMQEIFTKLDEAKHRE